MGAGHRRNPTQNANLVLAAELAGAKPEDVDITLGDNGLTISGERKAEEEEERGDYYISERRYGSFSRSLPLPQGIEQSKINVRFENGVLEATIEGVAAVQESRRIQDRGFGHLSH